MLLKVNTRPPIQRGLEGIVKENIEVRTGRRLHGLHVSQVGNEVIIRGNAPSYYIKQLALTSVLKTLRPLGTVRIVDDIRVSYAAGQGLGAFDG
jgi:hypothetical protein